MVWLDTEPNNKVYHVTSTHYARFWCAINEEERCNDSHLYGKLRFYCDWIVNNIFDLYIGYSTQMTQTCFVYFISCFNKTVIRSEGNNIVLYGTLAQWRPYRTWHRYWIPTWKFQISYPKTNHGIGWIKQVVHMEPKQYSTTVWNTACEI